MDTDYVDVEYISPSGKKLKEKIFIDLLPDIYIGINPVELLEFYYSPQGKGYRTTYSHREPFPIKFTVGETLLNQASSSNTKKVHPLLKGKLHKHDYFELILVVSEELEMQIESKLCKLNKWDICILNRSTRHTELFKLNEKVFFLTLSPDYLLNWPQEEGLNLSRNFVISKFLSKGLRDTLQQNKDYIIARYMNQEVDSPIHEVMQDIKKEFEVKRIGYQFFIRGLIYRLFIILSETTCYETDYIDLGFDNGFSLAFSVKQLLDKNKTRVTKQNIADQLNYSSEHINRVFKKHYGQTIPDYNKIICMRHAALLLRSTSKNVHNICKQLGFVNRTHFYSLFKKQYGCSPAEYRKNSVNK